MRCAHTPTVVSMKVFVEINVIFKMIILLQLLILAKNRSPAGFVALEDFDQPIGKIFSNLPKCDKLA